MSLPEMRLAALVLALTVLAGPVWAEKGAGFSNIEAAEAPRSDAGRAVATDAAGQDIDTDMIYATRADGTGLPGPQVAAPRPDPTFRAPLGGQSTVIVLVVLFGAVLLWLRFGGTGMLLRRAPLQDRPDPEAPSDWQKDLQITAEPGGSVLDMIAAMPDRRAALVALLRHCLMRSASDSATRFARADTERQAFLRLPLHVSRRDGLQRILQAAELAHYGGRIVDDSAFAAAMTEGRAIFAGTRGGTRASTRGGAHG